MLIIFAGLPGTGKTTIARRLAREISAVHVRIDSIEQAIRESREDGLSMDDTGYRVAYAVAEDNLRLGHTVIADSVNPLVLTRNAWINVARRVGVEFIEVECQCSEEREHRRRIDTRVADIPGLVLPTWADVTARQYDTWDRARLVIETTNNLEDNVATIRAAIESRAS